MPNPKSEKEIRDYFKALHDELTAIYYAEDNTLTKELFDVAHGKIWGDMEHELRTGGYLPPPPVNELDIIKADIKALDNRVKALHELIAIRML